MRDHRFLFTFLMALAFAIPPQALGATQSYKQQNLVSLRGIGHRDKQLINPWGIAFGPATFIWAADNNAGVGTLYDQVGHKQSRVVTIPTPNGTGQSAPTGVVFNPDNGISPARANSAMRFLSSPPRTVPSPPGNCRMTRRERQLRALPQTHART